MPPTWVGVPPTTSHHPNGTPVGAMVKTDPSAAEKNPRALVDSAVFPKRAWVGRLARGPHAAGDATTRASTYCLVAACNAAVGSAGSWIGTRNVRVIRTPRCGSHQRPGLC